jgi:hypothetical protein
MASPIKASEFDGDLAGFLNKYKFQPVLTPRLDCLEGIEFTQELVNEIVLWKVNRFVSLNIGLLRQIENLKRLNPGDHKQAESVLISLLSINGVDLPMASTIVRFRNPAVFQIIDRHAYRAIYGSHYPLYTGSLVSKKIQTYFDYLDELRKLCDRKKLAFETVDRVLYQFDKDTNGKLKAE